MSAHGLAWFSMRKLAAALDVNPMTVYLRFADKDELLDAVARHSLEQLELPPLPAGSWCERATSLCVQLRHHLVADRNLLGLYASGDRMSLGFCARSRRASSSQRRSLPGDAAARFRTLFRHTVGWPHRQQLRLVSCRPARRAGRHDPRPRPGDASRVRPPSRGFHRSRRR
ncbi:MAG: helix-turn-helix domain-containing protein [Acidimicrobiales bacterium]